MILSRVAPILAILVTALLASGQSATTPKQFEVASVKPYMIQDGNFMIRTMPGGNFRAVGVTLKMLIMFAYNLKAFQVLAAPEWARTELWEIQAKDGDSEDHHSRADSQARVRALLEERYQLKVRRERRTMPVYALVVAKSSGAMLTAASTDKEPDICPCAPGSLAPHRASVAMLADRLSTVLWRVVIDKTGITGEYTFNLKWAPAPNETGEALGLPPVAEPSPSANDASIGPSVFTALREQLGLRLEPRKGPVEVVVIERAEKPKEN